MVVAVVVMISPICQRMRDANPQSTTATAHPTLASDKHTSRSCRLRADTAPSVDPRRPGRAWAYTSVFVFRTRHCARLDRSAHFLRLHTLRGLPACWTPSAPHQRHFQTLARCSPGRRPGWVMHFCPLERPQCCRQAVRAIRNRWAFVPGGLPGRAWADSSPGRRNPNLRNCSATFVPQVCARTCTYAVTVKRGPAPKAHVPCGSRALNKTNLFFTA